MSELEIEIYYLFFGFYEHTLDSKMKKKSFTQADFFCSSSIQFNLKSNF